MNLREKVYAGILVGWVGVLGVYGYLKIKEGTENYAKILFIESNQIENEMHSTQNSCLTQINAYGKDLDGIKRLELEIDNQHYITKEFNDLEKITEYSITFDLCHPKLQIGTHEIELKITDVYDNEETDTGIINVTGEIQRI